jgi:hypothetical protein
VYDVRDGYSPSMSPPAPSRSGLSLTGIGAVAVLCGISLVAGLVDVLAGDSLRLVFAGGLVVGAIVAALLVVRRDLLVVVFAPPLVYVLGSAIAVLLGRGNVGGGLIDAAAGWLIYGFPAMATATGVAAIIAAIRHARSSR